MTIADIKSTSFLIASQFIISFIPRPISVLRIHLFLAHIDYIISISFFFLSESDLFVVWWSVNASQPPSTCETLFEAINHKLFGSRNIYVSCNGDFWCNWFIQNHKTAQCAHVVHMFTSTFLLFCHFTAAEHTVCRLSYFGL